MKKVLRKEVIKLPFKVGETYKTKMATGENFTIDEILYNKDGSIRLLVGIYEFSPNLKGCPLYPERLIAQEEFSGKEFEVCICPHCNKDILV